MYRMRRQRIVSSWALAATAVFFPYASPAQATVPPNATNPLPPMAWSSWNSFSNTVNSDIIVRQANALISSGLQKAGYEYVNIDEGWWMGERDVTGNMIVDPKMWPAIANTDRAGDMTNIVRYLHMRGLKVGIYTDAGNDGCSISPDLGPAYFNEGSKGHYEQDFLQFAKWGFDFVKVDWCGGDKEGLSAELQYSEIARAIVRAEQVTGHKLYYSICDWGRQSPWTWAPGVGGATQDTWRVSDDIVAPIVAGSVNAGRKSDFGKMLRNFDQGVHPEAQHTGYYNDPDMMVVGMPGFNAQQNRLHIALWAVSGAPLIVGADVSRLDPETLASLTNVDAITIDQDPLGLQGVKVKEISPGLEVWSKFLAPRGSRGVLLLNRSYFPAPMSLGIADLGLIGDSASVRNVWSHKDVDISNAVFSVTVPAQDGVLLLVQGEEGKFTFYKPVPIVAGVGKTEFGPETIFRGVASEGSPVVQIRIDYSNPTQATKVLNLFINEQTSTRVAFPPSPATQASVWIQARLDSKSDDNTLLFASDSPGNVKIHSIGVH